MPTGIVKDGDLRFARMDSVSEVQTLPEGSYAFSENMVNRGGVLQTRPGIRRMFTLPSGQLQGLSVYQPRLGSPVLVAFVDGTPYVSAYPFRDSQEIPGARMSETAKRVYTAQTTKSVERNFDGSLKLILPKSLLMVQDGVNPPAYFDGQSMTALVGANKTPQGTYMAWAGGRLWVARREQLFASDIADPLTFIEQTTNTLGGISYFILPGPCTGLARMPGASSSIKTPLLAFTGSTCAMFRANILNRSLWSQAEDFQVDLLPNIGCVASRSLTAHAGMLWWYSQHGQVRLDSAQASEVSSRINYIDQEMVRSASNLHSDLSGIASVNFENFLLTSVPHASKYNRHTWVFDGSPDDRLGAMSPAAWSSVWTGVQPVEWVKLEVNGRTRLFCASVDADGNNRIYEAFTDERRDNGCDIPWAFETRGYTAGVKTNKHFRYLEYGLSEIAGQLDMKISWAGTDRGPWKEFASPTFKAKEGNISADEEIAYSTQLYALKKQSRLARTQDVRDLPNDDLSSAGVEGPIFSVEPTKEAIDSAFQFRFEGSGQVAFRSLRVFMDQESEPDSGQPVESEDDDHFVRFDGAASDDEATLQAATPVTYTATATRVAQWNNFAAEAEATVISSISQSDADKRAAQVAQSRAEERLRLIAEPYVGGSLT